jgi:hypothetical protein
MYLSLTLTLTDIPHVLIEKCKSRISRHIKVKTLKRKWSPNSHSYIFKKERTPTSIYLWLTWLQVLCNFTLATHLLREIRLCSVLYFYITLLEKFIVFMKNVIIGWLMNSVILASSWLMSILNNQSSYSAWFSFLIFWLYKVWIQGFRFAKQILCHLSYTSSLFTLDIFGDGSSWNICTSPKTLKYENKWILEKKNE